jgi:hypothetical protein
MYATLGEYDPGTSQIKSPCQSFCERSKQSERTSRHVAKTFKPIRKATIATMKALR